MLLRVLGMQLEVLDLSSNSSSAALEDAVLGLLRAITARVRPRRSIACRRMGIFNNKQSVWPGIKSDSVRIAAFQTKSF